MLQVRSSGLLAQLYVQRGAFDRAAAVHEALALRRSGANHGEEATLQQRVDSLRDAVLQVCIKNSPEKVPLEVSIQEGLSFSRWPPCSSA